MRSELTVPAVDLTPYTRPHDRGDRQRAAVARAMGQACSDLGFVQVHGHQVPEEVIDGLADAIDSFFSLPPEVKSGYRVGDPAVNRGYTPPRAESLSRSLGVDSDDHDLFEAFNVGVEATAYPHLDLPADYAANLWPAELPDFRGEVEQYLDEAGRVARVLTTVFADALDLPSAYFDAFTDHSLDVLRMNNYAVPTGEPALGDDDPTGMGAHTDYGIVTVLWADRVAGLQVLAPDGRWYDVMPEPGALLVNLGDLTATWTNDRWRSTMHRVKPPVVDGSVARRRSAAYFHDGNLDAVVEPLASCIDAEHPARYGRVSIAEHLRAKLAGSRAGLLNPDAEADAARLRGAR